MHSEQNRALQYAVLASIVLHGALLSSVPWRERVRLEEPPPLVARLAEPPAPPALVAPQPEPVKPKPARPKPVAKAKPMPPAPVQQPVEELVVEKREPPQAPLPPVAEAAPAPAPEPMPPVIARTEPSASPPVLAPAEPKKLDAASVAQYRLQLISAARKFKNYPRVAMENNWEGDVVVRMEFRGNGLLAGVTIRSSSGHRVLDQQALDMFRKAAAAVFVPAALHGQEFSFEVRAVYNLRDQDSG